MNTLTRVSLFVVIAIILVVAAKIYGGVFTSTKPTSEGNVTQSTAPSMEELKVEEIVVGNGREAKTGDTVEVHYLGTLTDGTKFDSSYDRNAPFSFTIGGKQVIEGWEQGIVGMKIGGKRKLTIPPSLAYGPQSRGPIPSNATLVFEVELLGIK